MKTLTAFPYYLICLLGLLFIFCTMQQKPLMPIKRAQLLRFFVSHTKANSTVCMTLTRRPPLHVWYSTLFRWVPTECLIALVATASYPSLCGRGFIFPALSIVYMLPALGRMVLWSCFLTWKRLTSITTLFLSYHIHIGLFLKLKVN